VIIGVITLDLGVIVFRTGSMSPTIPTGAAALVRQIPADQVEVGDVVTVPSPLGPLPVTHRVIATEQLADGTTRLRLRGDANDSEDPFPYDVTEVRRVVVSAPGVGYALVRLGDPWVMGSVTVGVAALVGWALWPRQRERPGGRRPRRAERTRRDPDPAPSDPRPDPVAAEPPVRRRRATTGASLALLALAAVLATGTITAPPASAAGPSAAVPTPPADGYPADPADPTSRDVLRLRSSLPMGERWMLSPGTDLRWRVESSVQPPDGAAGATGTVWVSLFAGGPLVEADGAVRISLELCDQGWAADGGCPGGARTVDAPAADGEVELDRVLVGAVTSQDPQEVVVRMQVPADLGDEYQGLGMSLGLRFDAFGEETYLSEVLAALDDDGAAGGFSSDVLGVTGADLRPAAWAVLALLLGTIALVWASDRRRYRAALAAARRTTDEPAGPADPASGREEVTAGARAP
jgi:signal peptidase